MWNTFLTIGRYRLQTVYNRIIYYWLCESRNSWRDNLKIPELVATACVWEGKRRSFLPPCNMINWRSLLDCAWYGLSESSVQLVLLEAFMDHLTSLSVSFIDKRGTYFLYFWIYPSIEFIWLNISIMKLSFVVLLKESL